MSVRFSEDGPAFPEDLVDALLAGDVVFFCGAGVSAPQLPGFGKLVEDCFKNLRVGMKPSEIQSFEAGRYEEVLGSLKRGIINPANFTRTIKDLLLKPPKTLDLSHHHTILRLSRDIENRPVIVTTNFDTLFEQALLESEGEEGEEDVQALSFAGPSLPPPGSAGFGGIIHLHGRIDSQTPKLDATPLVITSADYGDAYMRSGWASRFLFDLCRCKTIVLIGYSAGDAPVRYFLNVLDVDRQRFPDLCPVYALTDVAEHGKQDDRWDALAVTPISYVCGTDEKTHDALWRDLKMLADLVEKPHETRRVAAQKILTKPFSDANSDEKDYVAWLLSSSSDLWPTAIQAIKDAAWFHFFADRKIWTNENATWAIAQWTTDVPECIERFEQAVQWLEKLGKPFAVEIARRLQLKPMNDLPDLWRRVWRLLSISEPDPKGDWDLDVLSILKTLQGPVVLNADLEDAVDLLTPALQLSSARNKPYGDSESAFPKQLRDFPLPQLHFRGWKDDKRDLLDALIETQHAKAISIMLIATARLQSVIGMLRDIEDIQDDHDRSDLTVPSIEPHQQNKYHNGPVALVELLASLLPKAAEEDRSATRGITEVWRAMPGNLGTRLWLHALRNETLFTADEAISGLAALSKRNFWRLQREFPLALQDRAADANAELVNQVEHRILTECDGFYGQYSLKEGQADWRPHARDNAVWLRLNMIDAASKLSDTGAAELAAIKTRRNYLDQKVVDHDFFSSYSTGGRVIVGNAEAIKNTPEQDRPEFVRNAVQNMDWNAYCRTDPSGAFDVLSKDSFAAVNAELWPGLIDALSFPEDQRDPIHSVLADRLFEALGPASDDFLALIIGPLVDLYARAPRQEKSEISAWWPRLFKIAIEQDDAFLEHSENIIALARNSAAGSLTKAALIDIKQRQTADKPVSQELLDAVSQAALAKGRQGLFARVMLIIRLDCILKIEGQTISELLDEALTGETPEARALRSTLVTQGEPTRSVSQAFSAHILRGVTEVSGKNNVRNAAHKILAPALSIICRESDEKEWNITLDDVATALQDGPAILREEAVFILQTWITKIKGGPAEVWTDIALLLDRVWPRERALCHKGLTPYFANLAIKADDAFPEALEWVLPYLSATKGRDAIRALEESQIPEKFPQETLRLLWTLFGVESKGDLFGLSQILDRLIKAKSEIESDRRLQSLKQRAVRYE